jgi:hypothetical protein
LLGLLGEDTERGWRVAARHDAKQSHDDGAYKSEMAALKNLPHALSPAKPDDPPPSGCLLPDDGNARHS